MGLDSKDACFLQYLTQSNGLLKMHKKQKNLRTITTMFSNEEATECPLIGSDRGLLFLLTCTEKVC